MVLKLEDYFLTVMNSPVSNIVRKRSVFKGAMAYVEDRKEAEFFLKSIKQNSKGAAHNIMAYLLFETNLAYCSDDGEPSKTAGEPVLNIIKRSGVYNVCVVVTRYFGGILLGTGGLVEAYSSACKALFDDVVYAKCCLCVKVKMIVDYGSYNKLSFLFKKFNVSVLDVDFAEAVTVEFYVESSNYCKFDLAVKQKIGAGCCCEILEKKWNRLKLEDAELEEFKLKRK